MDHLFCSCTFTRFQWVSFVGLIGCDWLMQDSIINVLSSWWCHAFVDRGKMVWRLILAIILWCMCRESNLTIFESKELPAHNFFS